MKPPPAPRRIIITGASSGLGAGLARAYAAPGVTLGLVARDARRLGQVASDCRARGAAAETAALDVADAPALAGFIAAFDDAGPIDLVVANAGIARGTSAQGALESQEDATRQIAVNVLGVINTLGPALPRMQARGAGHVAVVASVAALRGLPDSPAYCASKAAVRLYGESLRGALGPHGITVSVIVPGFFDSAMSRRFIGAQPMAMTLEQAVARVKSGLDRGRARIVLPRRLAVLLRIADLLPAVLGDKVIRLFRFHIAAS